MSTQKPTLGRIVIAIVDPDDPSNGEQDEATSLVTRVHDDTTVDLIVFPAGDGPPRKVKKAQLCGSRTAALKALGEHVGDLPVRKDQHGEVIKNQPHHVVPWVPVAYWPIVTSAKAAIAAAGGGDGEVK